MKSSLDLNTINYCLYIMITNNIPLNQHMLSANSLLQIYLILILVNRIILGKYFFTQTHRCFKVRSQIIYD